MNGRLGDSTLPLRVR